MKKTTILRMLAGCAGFVVLLIAGWMGQASRAFELVQVNCATATPESLKTAVEAALQTRFPDLRLISVPAGQSLVTARSRNNGRIVVTLEGPAQTQADKEEFLRLARAAVGQCGDVAETLTVRCDLSKRERRRQLQSALALILPCSCSVVEAGQGDGVQIDVKGRDVDVTGSVVRPGQRAKVIAVIDALSCGGQIIGQIEERQISTPSCAGLTREQLRDFVRASLRSRVKCDSFDLIRINRPDPAGAGNMRLTVQTFQPDRIGALVRTILSEAGLNCVTVEVRPLTDTGPGPQGNCGAGSVACRDSGGETVCWPGTKCPNTN